MECVCVRPLKLYCAHQSAMHQVPPVFAKKAQGDDEEDAARAYVATLCESWAGTMRMAEISYEMSDAATRTAEAIEALSAWCGWDVMWVWCGAFPLLKRAVKTALMVTVEPL
jgi:hypothetical protein